MTKALLRQQMRRRRGNLTATDRDNLGHQWSERFARLPLFRNCTSFAAYWPCKGEIDTRALMTSACNQGKAVYLPTISADKMWFSLWDGRAPALNHAFGLRQPPKKARRLPNLRTLDFIVVPLLAFDRRGRRLGQGGGFYDRHFQLRRFQRWHKPILIGAAYDFQEVASVPLDDWDVSLDLIVTNDDIIHVADY